STTRSHVSTPSRYSRPLDTSSCCFVYDCQTLTSFWRAVTDLATYAYWTDVVVSDVYRRQGIGRWLSETMLAHPQLQGLRRVSLLTRDAESLYAQLGFREGAGSLKYMEYRDQSSGSETPAA